MKKTFIFLMCVLFSGCVVATQQAQEPLVADQQTKEMVKVEEKASSSGDPVRKLVSTRQVLKGMSGKEVESVLGTEVLVGYELTEGSTGQYKPITIKNPYRSEDIKKGSKLYRVEYYFVSLNTQDGKVTDDELVPFIFIDGMLISKDWEYLNKRVKN